jgi:hypothetical protein
MAAILALYGVTNGKRDSVAPAWQGTAFDFARANLTDGATIDDDTLEAVMRLALFESVGTKIVIGDGAAACFEMERIS